jgi:hypothetical protein
MAVLLASCDRFGAHIENSKGKQGLGGLALPPRRFSLYQFRVYGAIFIAWSLRGPLAAASIYFAAGFLPTMSLSLNLNSLMSSLG